MLFRARLCYSEMSPVHSLAIEFAHGLLGSARFCHLDEGKASGLARHAIRDEVHGSGFSDRSKALGQRSRSCLVIQVAYVQFLGHFPFLM